MRKVVPATTTKIALRASTAIKRRNGHLRRSAKSIAKMAMSALKTINAKSPTTAGTIRSKTETVKRDAAWKCTLRKVELNSDGISQILQRKRRPL